MSPSGDGWVNAPAALRPIENDLFLLACTGRKLRVAWAIRAFVIEVILSELGGHLRTEVAAELEQELRDLRGRKLQAENYRGEELRVARTVGAARERTKEAFK